MDLGSGRNEFRIGDHVCEDGEIDGTVHLVDVLVLAPHPLGQIGIAIAERVHDIGRHVVDGGAESPQGLALRHSRSVLDDQDTLGDIGRKIAHALQIAGRLERRHDATQILGHGLAQCHDARDQFFHLALMGVDPLVAVDDVLGEGAVAVHKSLHGVADLVFHDSAHGKNAVRDLLEFGIVGTDSVLDSHGNPSAKCAHPNLPVM